MVHAVLDRQRNHADGLPGGFAADGANDADGGEFTAMTGIKIEPGEALKVAFTTTATRSTARLLTLMIISALSCCSYGGTMAVYRTSHRMKERGRLWSDSRNLTSIVSLKSWRKNEL